MCNSSWALQVLHSDVWFSIWWWFGISRCDDNLPALLILVMTNCLFLCFSCSVGSLTPMPKPESFAIVLVRLRKLLRKSFLFLTFWKMISVILRPLTLPYGRSRSFHYKEIIGKQQIWYVVEVKRTGKALPIPIIAFVEESSQTPRQKPPIWDVCVQTLSFFKSYQLK